MVKEFLLNKKDQLLNKLKKGDSLEKINGLLEEIDNFLESQNFFEANKKYLKIQSLYKNLTEEQRQEILNKCIEAYNKIKELHQENITEGVSSESNVEEPKNEQQESQDSSEQKINEDSAKPNDNSNEEVEKIPEPEEQTPEITPASSIEQQSDQSAEKISEQPAVSEETSSEQIEKEEEEDPDKIEYIKTNVPGFDDLIENGIPKGSNILVSGSAGSGKTTFTSQVLMNNATMGKRCFYMSFEESELRMKRHLRQYGWDPDKLIKSGNLLIRRYDPFLISRSIEALLAEARGELVIQIDKTKGLIPDDFKPEIIVVDSLSAIAAAFAGEEAAYRIYIEQLFRSFEKIGVTSFLITECEEGTGKWSKTGVEEFLADGVVAFYNMKKGNSRVNAIEVLKLRGTGHKKKISPFNFIQGKGIEVYPLQEIFTE